MQLKRVIQNNNTRNEIRKNEAILQGVPVPDQCAGGYVCVCVMCVYAYVVCVNVCRFCVRVSV
jgi:hypothetical protein